MNCVKCGTANNDDAVFCSNCGENLKTQESQIQTNTNAQDQMPQTFAEPPVYFGQTEESQYSPEQPGPKKKKRVFRFAMLTIILVAVIGGAVALAATVFKGDVMQAVKGKDKYARDIVGDAILKLTDGIIDSAAGYDKLMTEDVQSAGSLQLSFSAAMSESDLDYLCDELYLYGDSEAIFRILASSDIDATINYDFNSDNPKFEALLKCKIKNENILNLSLAVADNTIYITCPELYDKSLALNLSELDVNMQDIMDGMMSSVNTSNDLAAVFDIFNVINNSSGELKAMLRDMVTVFLEDLEDVNIENDASVVINGNTARLDRIVMNITEDDFQRAFSAALKVLKDNDGYIDTIVSIANSVNDPYTTISNQDIKDDLDKAISDLSYYSGSGETIEVDIYTDSAGNIKGVRLLANESDFGFAYNEGTGYEFWVINSNDYSDGERYEQSARIYGDLKSGSSGLSGNMYISSSETWSNEPEWNESFEIKLFDFENFKSDGMNITSGRLILNIGELIDAMTDADMIYGSVDGYDILAGSVLELDLSTKGNTSLADLTFKNQGKGVDVKLGIGTETGNISVNIPSESDVVTISLMDLMLGNMPDIDFYKLESNLFVLIDKIDSMGIDVSWLYDAIEEVFYYLP